MRSQGQQPKMLVRKAARWWTTHPHLSSEDIARPTDYTHLVHITPELIDTVLATEHKFLQRQVQRLGGSGPSFPAVGGAPQIVVCRDFRHISTVTPHTGDPTLRVVQISKRALEPVDFTFRHGSGWEPEDTGFFVDALGLGSPAEEMGLLRVGDEVLAINNLATADLTLEEVNLLCAAVAHLVLIVRPAGAPVALDTYDHEAPQWPQPGNRVDVAARAVAKLVLNRSLSDHDGTAATAGGGGGANSGGNGSNSGANSGSSSSADEEPLHVHGVARRRRHGQKQANHGLAPRQAWAKGSPTTPTAAASASASRTRAMPRSTLKEFMAAAAATTAAAMAAQTPAPGAPYGMAHMNANTNTHANTNHGEYDEFHPPSSGDATAPEDSNGTGRHHDVVDGQHGAQYRRRQRRHQRHHNHNHNHAAESEWDSSSEDYVRSDATSSDGSTYLDADDNPHARARAFGRLTSNGSGFSHSTPSLPSESTRPYHGKDLSVSPAIERMFREQLLLQQHQQQQQQQAEEAQRQQQLGYGYPHHHQQPQYQEYHDHHPQQQSLQYQQQQYQQQQQNLDLLLGPPPPHPDELARISSGPVRRLRRRAWSVGSADTASTASSRPPNGLIPISPALDRRVRQPHQQPHQQQRLKPLAFRPNDRAQHPHQLQQGQHFPPRTQQQQQQQQHSLSADAQLLTRTNPTHSEHHHQQLQQQQQQQQIRQRKDPGRHRPQQPRQQQRRHGAITGVLSMHVISASELPQHLQHSNLPVWCDVYLDQRVVARTEHTKTLHWDEVFHVDTFQARVLRIVCLALGPSGRVVIGEHRLPLSSVALADRGIKNFRLKLKPGAATSGNTGLPSQQPVVLKFSLQLRSSSRSPPRRADSGGVVLGQSFGCPLDAVPCLSSAGTGDIPLVVAACVAEIEKRGLREPGLYSRVGAFGTVRELQRSADSGNMIDFLDRLRQSDIHTVTSLLCLFFAQLSNPLVSSSVATSLIVAAATEPDPSKQRELVLAHISSLNAQACHVTECILEHIGHVLVHKGSNHSDVDRLAVRFAHLLLAPGPKTAAGMPADALSFGTDWSAQIALCKMLLLRFPAPRGVVVVNPDKDMAERNTLAPGVAAHNDTHGHGASVSKLSRLAKRAPRLHPNADDYTRC